MPGVWGLMVFQESKVAFRLLPWQIWYILSDDFELNGTYRTSFQCFFRSLIWQIKTGLRTNSISQPFLLDFWQWWALFIPVSPFFVLWQTPSLHRCVSITPVWLWDALDGGPLRWFIKRIRPWWTKRQRLQNTTTCWATKLLCWKFVSRFVACG